MNFIATTNNNKQEVILKDTISGTEAIVYTFGALLNSFSVVNQNSTINIIDGFASPADAKQNITKAFKSAKLSPFVCRLKKGEFTYNNHSYQVKKFLLNGQALHGLLYDADFILKQLNADDHKAKCELIYRYNKPDEGFSFIYTISVTYLLEMENRLTITTEITNADQTDMPISDGWHPYFKLCESIDDCSLQFNSNTQIEFDENLIPTGKKITDERFLQPFSLKHVELDNCFELNAYQNKPQCLLTSDNFKLAIQPDDSYPFLQVYTPPHRKSIAIENLSSTPDSFNNGMGLITLQPGEKKKFTTSFQILNTS